MAPEISSVGLMFTGGLVAIAAAIAGAVGLGLSQALLGSAIRCVLQLWALGFVLGWIFRSGSPLWTGLAILVMTVVASRTALKRVSFRYQGIALHAFAGLALSGWGLGVFAIHVLLPGTSWNDSSVVLPLIGLLLGNCLSGISLGLAHWTRALKDHQQRIELGLAHGASRWEAVRLEFQEALKTAITPVLNSMSVAGVVSLPGMMTGQLLAGADPHSAVKYQIGIMLLVGVGTLSGACVAIVLGFFGLLSPRHQLLEYRLEGAR